MLARYQMKRGLRQADMPARLRKGVRQAARKHTQHILRPPAELVDAFLADPEGTGAFSAFAKGYRGVLADRFRADRDAFDQLAELARRADVFIGCSCPTTKNPSVKRCHTWLALQFMQEHYPDLDVTFPR